MILFIISVFLLTGCLSNQKMTEQTWHLTFPESAEEIYHRDTGSSPHGDGFRYTVYELTDTEDLPDFTEWTDTQLETKYAEDYEGFALQCLNKLDVPSEERMDFDACVYSYSQKEDSSELLLMYDPEVNRLYVIEEIL